MTAKLFLAPLFLAWGFLAVLPAKPVLAQQQVTAPAEANTSAQTVAPTATDSLSASPATNSPSAGEAAPAGSPPQPASSPPETVPADDAAALLLPHDLSPWGMFRNADLVVQLVMAGLAFASFVTWTVFFAKALHLLLLNRRMTAALRRLDDAPSLDQARASLGLRAGLGQVLVSAAVVELDLSGPAPVDGIKERIASRLDRLVARLGRGMNRGTGVLATIGSTAPFVGLFGTVWGIMNSFIGISKAHTTNLAVVAPGIAEALLATAIGLVAAIPAVVVYNLLARGIAANKAVVADMSAAVLRLASRDLDQDRAVLSRAA